MVPTGTNGVDLAEVVRRCKGTMTQEQFAERIGRTQTAVSYWLAGERCPQLDDVAVMLDVADLTWADVFGLPDSQAAYRHGYADGFRAASRAIDRIRSEQ